MTNTIFTDYIGLNEYTDSKGYELIIRVFEDGFAFAWYVDADSKKVIDDSQFDCSDKGGIDSIEEKLKLYHVSEK
jgi:hypothetical protein